MLVCKYMTYITVHCCAFCIHEKNPRKKTESMISIAGPAHKKQNIWCCKCNGTYSRIIKSLLLFFWRLTLKLAGCWQDNPMRARQLLFHSLVKGRAGRQKSFLLTRLISFISPAACLFACQVLPGSECIGGVRSGATATLMHLWSLSWSP